MDSSPGSPRCAEGGCPPGSIPSSNGGECFNKSWFKTRMAELLWRCHIDIGGPDHRNQGVQHIHDTCWVHLWLLFLKESVLKFIRLLCVSQKCKNEETDKGLDLKIAFCCRIYAVLLYFFFFKINSIVLVKVDHDQLLPCWKLLSNAVEQTKNSFVPITATVPSGPSHITSHAWRPDLHDDDYDDYDDDKGASIASISAKIATWSLFFPLPHLCFGQLGSWKVKLLTRV